MLYESNYLMHYRTKNSKNGVRRYQKEDGSLTPEGREHYGVGEPRKAGGVGLHDKQGNKVSVASNVKAAYKNAPGVDKAAFKMLFKKKNNNKPTVAGDIGQKKTGNSESNENAKKSEEPKKMSKQQKLQKASRVMLRAAQVTAAAALIGYGIKNRNKIKEAASFITDMASDLHTGRKIGSNYRKAIRTQAKADKLRNKQGYVKDRMSRAKKLDRKAEAYRSKARQSMGWLS